MSTLEKLLADDAFEDETFDAIRAGEAELSGKELYRCVFRHAKLNETAWSRTRLEDCVFESCDLTRARIEQLSLRSVTFKQCKLMGIDWSGLNTFPVVSFSDCNLRYASFVGLTLNKTRFERCGLNECNFLQTQLAEAHFEDCDFSGARIDGCDLRGANFVRARGLFIDPTKNQVKGVSIPTESAQLLAASFGMRIRD